MKNYGIIYGYSVPKSIDVTDTSVFIASDIEPYEHEISGNFISGYQYNYIEYTKDEYIAKLSEDNAALQQQVLETQEALCDLYESLEGGE